MKVKVHIEQLILDGINISDEQQPIFQEAFRSELTRLLAEQGLGSGLAAGGALRELPGASVQMTPGVDPTSFGRQVAGAVYGVLGR